MKAERLPDGRAKLWLSRSEMFQLPGLLSEAAEWLWRKKDKFPTRVGISYEEVHSLGDELLLTRNGLLDIPPLVVPQTGQVVGTTRVRKAHTPWDFLPQIEAEKLSDDRFALVLARGELTILANCLDVILQETAHMGPKGRDSELHSRMDMRVRDVEMLRDELRRLDQKTRTGGTPR